MLYVNKAPEVPPQFAEIVSRYETYDKLSSSGADRDAIKLILLNEQGCLCPYCERQLEISDASIEHFHPESSFPRLQLDYYNLFACCHVCNRNKTDHLIPAYVFDVRLNALDPKHLILDRHQDFQIKYVQEGTNDVVLRIMPLEKTSKDKRQEDANWMLFLTTEILGLNEPTRLKEPRAKVLSMILKLTDDQPTKKDQKTALIKLYQKYRATTEALEPISGQLYHRHESFLSMILFALAERLRQKGVDITTL